MLVQRLILHSHHAMVSEPLERLGHCVSVYLALNSACTKLNHSSTRPDDQYLLDLTDNKELHNGRLQLAEPVCTTGQDCNMRSALDMFRGATGIDTYDVLIILRYDVRLLRPITSWNCHRPDLLETKSQPLGLTSIITDHSWAREKRTHDVIHVVPRAHFGAFDSAIGRKRKNACCFNGACHIWGGLGTTGHWCLPFFLDNLKGGMNNISFCFKKENRYGYSARETIPNIGCCRGDFRENTTVLFLAQHTQAQMVDHNWTMRDIARIPMNPQEWGSLVYHPQRIGPSPAPIAEMIRQRSETDTQVPVNNAAHDKKI